MMSLMDKPHAPMITFSDRHTHFIITFVDIVSSTEVTAALSGKKSDFLYATFLNTLARVVEEYDAVVVKNMGDGLLYYFPESDFGDSEIFDKSIRCARAVLAAQASINTALAFEDIEPIQYRVSLSYGPVSIAEGEDGAIKDIFGSTVNTCAKMNKLARPQSIIIGEALHQELEKYAEYVFIEQEPLVISDALILKTYSLQEGV